MARTISFAAALGLFLLGVVFAVVGYLPAASVESGGMDLPEGVLATARDPLERRAEARGHPPQTLASLPADLVPRSRPVPVLRSSEPRPRPELRSFWAKGPLVARVMDPAFGPQLRPWDLLIPDPPKTLTNASDLLCIAVAIYHEARSQPLDGQLAVASVILNRARAPDRWGATPCAVVTPVQFSFLGSDGRHPPVRDREAWAIAVEMAREALERGPSPLVGRADHYHTPTVDPEWNEEMRQVIRIDDHIFFVDPATKG